MRLIEILVDGVPGSKGALQYRFEPGLNPWKQKGLFRLDTVVEILVSLFYPLAREKDPLGPGKSRRAGVTFEARGNTYRLTRDFSMKRAMLSQLEPGTQGSFRDLSSETRFITETLSRSVRLPSQKVFRTLLVAAPGTPKKSGAEAPSPVPVRSGAGPAADPAIRLAELRKELARIDLIKEMEIRIDEIQAALFRIEDDLRRLKPAREEWGRFQKEYEPYGVFDRAGLVTPQVVAKIKAFRSLAEKRESDLHALEERSAGLNAEVLAFRVYPWWQEPVLVAGVMVAVAAFVLTSYHRFYWLPVSIAGAVTAAVGYYIWYRRQERLAALRRRIRGLEPERAGVEKRFEIETIAVRKIREVLRIESLEEIEETITRWESLKEERKKAGEELARMEAEVGEERLLAEKERNQKELARLGEKLADLPPASMDPNALVQEIAELESAAGGKPGAGPETPLSVSRDAVTGLVEAMAELMGRKPAEVLALTGKALDSNVAAVTERKFSALAFAYGQVPAFRLANGTTYSWGELDSETQTLLKFAVQFTFWQYMATLEPMPLFLDLLSASPSERVTELTLTAARHISRKSQITVLSP